MDKFWEKLDRSGGPDSCWPWIGAKFKDSGYGCVSLSNKTVSTHRLAWVLANGAIPHGLWVLHRCDNRPCCNPTHLFLGTAKDNVQDMLRKGRNNTPSGDHHWMRRPDVQKGPANHNAALTSEDVSSIKAELVNGGTVVEIAARHGVRASTVSLILNGTNWNSVPWPDDASFPLYCEQHNRSLAQKRRLLSISGGRCATSGCDAKPTGARRHCDEHWKQVRKKSKDRRHHETYYGKAS